MRQSSQIFACIRTRWLGFNGVISTKPSAFYALGSPKALPLLACITLGTYAAALAIGHSKSRVGRKLWLCCAAILCLGCLGVFKYAGHGVRKAERAVLACKQVSLAHRFSAFRAIHRILLLSECVTILRKQTLRLGRALAHLERFLHFSLKVFCLHEGNAFTLVTEHDQSVALL